MSWWMVVVTNWLTWYQGCLKEVFCVCSCTSCTPRSFSHGGKQTLQLLSGNARFCSFWIISNAVIHFNMNYFLKLIPIVARWLVWSLVLSFPTSCSHIGGEGGRRVWPPLPLCHWQLVSRADSIFSSCRRQSNWVLLLSSNKSPHYRTVGVSSWTILNIV